MSQILFQIQSTFIVILMTIGILKRKQRNRHVPIMMTCIIWDVLLIVQIQLMRSAVQKASQVVDNHMLLNIHVSFALLTVIFYAMMLFTGKKVLEGSKSHIRIHRRLGITTYTLRILTFITSFYAVLS